MSTTKKIVLTVFTVLLVGALTFLIIWGVNNFNKVQQGLSGSDLYTQEDIDNAYRDGYNMALSDKGAFETQINELRNELTEKQAEVDALKNVESDNADLKNIIAQLEEEIVNLNKTITVYEKFVKDVEESNKVIATFMLDGAVYDMQSYNPGESVVFPVPADEYCRVNSWAVNSEAVDVANYVINENTTFVADVTFPYVITFVSNGAEHDEIICYPGERFDLPAEPVADFGYVFAGWSIDKKTVVDVATLPEANVTYYAVYLEAITLKMTYATQFPSVSGYALILFNVESLDSRYNNAYLYDYLVDKGNSLYCNGNEIKFCDGSYIDNDQWQHVIRIDTDNLISCGYTYDDIIEIANNNTTITLKFTFIKG